MNEKTIHLKKDLGIMETDDISDGYHTFDELHEHRTVLSSVICNICSHLDLAGIQAWKSVKQSDGTLLDGWLLAGIDTPHGQITYHINMKYWDMFDIQKVSIAPKYDGHTSDDVLKRVKVIEDIIRRSMVECEEEIDALRKLLMKLWRTNSENEIQ